MPDRDAHQLDDARRAWERYSRREFLSRSGIGLGSLALSSLLSEEARAQDTTVGPHHTPRAKSVIFLFMAGGPSQLDLFEDKPKLRELDGDPIPASLIQGKRFAFIDPRKQTVQLMGSPRTFAHHGECGMTFSSLLPHTAGIADKICMLRGMQTDIINHGPAKLLANTGSRLFGRPSMGSWILYGLGSETRDLPGFVVLLSGERGPNGGSTLWDSGFLSSRYQGVALRQGPEPIVDLRSPPGFDGERQRDFFETVRRLNEGRPTATEDDELRTRVEAYEMAARMQTSGPELTDLSREPQSVLDLYGVTPGEPSFATNCLLARRLVERGVRFVQLYHPDWDHHGRFLNLGRPLERICREVDQGSAALVTDLEQRGLLDDTLVVWGGEFGRTPMREPNVHEGRDHHIDAYNMWLAGGGVKRGHVHGATDEFGFDVVEGRVHVHDLHATILHLLGLDHLRLTFKFQGRDYRLTDVAGEIVHDILA